MKTYMCLPAPVDLWIDFEQLYFPVALSFCEQADAKLVDIKGHAGIFQSSKCTSASWSSSSSRICFAIFCRFAADTPGM